MDYPKTRKEAMAQGAKYYFTGEPCVRGHVSIRKTKGTCVACMKEDHQRDYEKRKDYIDAYNKSEAGQEARRRYYERNKEAVKARAQARPEEEKRRYRKNWKENHKDQVLADNKIRRKKHRDATPPWITREQKSAMRALYQQAMAITRTTGVPYVVDHQIPLRHPEVCGLHVPWNLQVMSREENLRKSNFHDNTFWIIYTPENPWRPLCP